jgi:protein-S-isoprenylcysteine O-methyltransferase Ste14
MLLREKRQRRFTSRYGVEGGYLRFRRAAATLMNLDAVAFILVCVLTRGTFGLLEPPALRISVGVIAVLVGATTKIWARKTLGSAGYHWRDFFYPPEPATVQAAGPYRWIKNPMYTVGYLHAYGLALIFDSAPGLILAAFMQVAVLTFNHIVERPHFAEISRKSLPTD